ncbi:hypothetical protein HPB52_018583 [Rhipicephalus sanguineus]|uniref:Uncharacterized protein n=1 Tax=Rhipicephalus sanguineus TaxID=34632 RepID=A0A9D4ST67_RHISA|nr:hypothetical protein HPB52_018583 [Rhipicephalus sanguineus]
MDTTGSAAAAAPARDGAAELGDLLVHLEGARGCFSGSLIDYRMPCTASEDTRCQIVASIPLWNEFLCWLKLELRELTGVGRQLGLVHRKNQGVPGNTYTDSWLGAMSKNDTLQHITLSVSIWTSECWEQFFRVLSRHRSLKMATIVAGEGELCRLSDIAKKLEKIGCEEKVSFVSSTSDDRFSLADCKNYSELRALDLQLSGIGFPTKSEDWWLPFSGSLLRNRSVTNLGLGVDVYPRNGFKYLGAAVARSKTIRELRSLTWSSSTRLSFLRGVRAGISENYALCSVALYPKSSYEDWEGDWSFVCDTARRNSGYVARTAQFLQQARCDTPCAAALDRVYRHPALVAELSKVLAISEADAVVAVRQHFRSIEGMHEFMRLAGVVKVHVTCLPRDDGRPQLNALDEYCWAHVRRYLQLDDVAWYCQSSTDVM